MTILHKKMKIFLRFTIKTRSRLLLCRNSLSLFFFSAPFFRYTFIFLKIKTAKKEIKTHSHFNFYLKYERKKLEKVFLNKNFFVLFSKMGTSPIFLFVRSSFSEKFKKKLTSFLLVPFFLQNKEKKRIWTDNYSCIFIPLSS